MLRGGANDALRGESGNDTRDGDSGNETLCYRESRLQQAASASRQMQRQAVSDEERAFVTEFLIFLIVDILFCATGALIFWVLTLGKCKINFPERSTPIYWGFSFIGFVAWALILFFILIGLGD
jgi:hypothetical protein